MEEIIEDFTAAPKHHRRSNPHTTRYGIGQPCTTVRLPPSSQCPQDPVHMRNAAQRSSPRALEGSRKAMYMHYSRHGLLLTP